MTTARAPAGSGIAPPHADWLVVLGGLLVLYVPTFSDLAEWHWRQEEGSHGPVILAVVAWLLWRGRAALRAAPEAARPAAGLAVLAFGLLVYVLGRSQDIALLQVASLVPVLSGVLLAMRGTAAMRALSFAVLFTLFMVPLPGMFVDTLTGPLKQSVSAVAESILYRLGYPVARSGVVLSIGQYQLLVADACSGLNSMISLGALGILYAHLAARSSRPHNAIMLVAILPIAYIANIVRVLLLLLITFHFGNDAGQGFLHGATGIVLLLVSLTSLVVLDAALARVMTPRGSR
jgi:exosortase B